MNEASCRGAWQGALREASHALEIMGRTSASTGRAATALVAFEAAAAATILGHFRAAVLLEQAGQDLGDELAEARKAGAAQLGIRLSLINWLKGEPVVSADLYGVANACLDDLMDQPDQPEVTFGLLLRCYIELRDFQRLRQMRHDLAAAWDAAHRGRGAIFVNASEELLNDGALSPRWCANARQVIERSIGWQEPGALGADSILQLRRIIAAVEQDARPGYEIAVSLCPSLSLAS